ncbi:hypothetical protein G9A89_013090 [Geosiphon pyriformis]|nr:hypothetical protein G9A89_013090 [Geosiphon pyriformis]
MSLESNLAKLLTLVEFIVKPVGKLKKTKVVTKTPNLTVLKFCHAIYTQNQSDLGLPEECCPAESVLTYYINTRINYHIEKEKEPHDTKLELYRELSQYTTKEVAPKFRTGFKNCEEESESESEKETSKKTITRPVIGTSSQSRNQETRDQEEEPDIREATFRDAQGNIIPPFLRPISPPAENSNEMTTLYITRLTDFSEEEEETDVHTWLREAQKAIHANNWNDQKAIQTLSFFLKGTADSWYQSLETKPTSFAKFKNALLKYFSDPNAVIQLQNEFNTIKQNTGETVTQYLARFN